MLTSLFVNLTSMCHMGGANLSQENAPSDWPGGVTMGHFSH